MIRSLSRRCAVVMLTLGALALSACGDRRSVEAVEQELGAPATKGEIIEFFSGNAFEIRHWSPPKLLGGTHWTSDGRIRGIRLRYSGGLNSLWQGGWEVVEENGTALLIRDITTYKPSQARCVDAFNLGVCKGVPRYDPPVREVSRSLVFIKSDGTVAVKIIDKSLAIGGREVGSLAPNFPTEVEHMKPFRDERFIEQINEFFHEERRRLFSSY